MSYTKLTDFASKDALLTGNPSKLVRGTELGAEFDAIETADALNIKPDTVTAATGKTTPVDADLFTLFDSASTFSLKKLTWANIKATLKTYFDTLYVLSGDNTTLTSLGNNTSTIYTTAGTATAFTITPTPVISAYAAGQSFVVNFNTVCGAAPTLAISGVATPPNLVKENSDGTFSNLAAGDIPINHRSRVTLISTTQALVEKMPQALTLGTSVATTSGTSIDFTGLPAWAKRVTLNLSGVSTNGSNDLLVQGGAGSIEATTYADVLSSLITGSAITSTTTGARISGATSAATSYTGRIVFELLGSNKWVYTHNFVRNDGIVAVGAGDKTFGGTLDRLRLTTVGGADTFDAGSANITYE